MLYFLIFLSGIVFCLIGLPLLDSISSLISSIFNFLLSFFNLLTAHLNAKILKLQQAVNAECSDGCANAIGFQSPTQEEYYDDEEYEDE